MKNLIVILLVLVISGFVYSQDDTEKENSLVGIRYDKWNNVTWYLSDEFLFAPTSLSLTDLRLKAGFSCNGKTSLNKPCKASIVYLNFSYTYPSSIWKFQPFDFQHKNVMAIVNNKRVSLGVAKVEYDSNLEKFRAAATLSFAQFKQLATAKSLDLAIGKLSSDESLDTKALVSLYNLALKAYSTPKTVSKKAKPKI